jgi:hypothetical protein
MRRETARKKISQVTGRTAAILAKGVDIGPYNLHSSVQRKSFDSLMDISSARIIRLRQYRENDNGWNNHYYVIGLKCVIHGINTITPIRIENICGYNLCLECSVDDPVGDLASEIIWKRYRVYEAFKRGETKEQIRKRAVDSELNARASRHAAPRRTHLSKDLSLESRFQLKIELYRETNDSRKDKLTKLLDTLDISQAQLIRSKSTLVSGLSCQVHLDVVIPNRHLSLLLEGANPCKSCISVAKSKNFRGKKHLGKWTTTLLRERLDCNLPPGLEHLDFTHMAVEHHRIGKSIAACAIGIRCIIHNETIPVVRIGSLLKGFARCGSCPTKHAYSIDRVRKMVEFSHEGNVELVDYCGTIRGRSTFKCYFCDYKWCAPANGVIGGKHRMPSGCPRCAKTYLVNESAVTHRLNELYEEVICDRICMLLPGTFAQQVACPSSTNRPLRIDFLVGIPGLGTWGVEVDGDQHYGHKFFSNDFTKIVERDTAKVKACMDQGIQIARLPLPILPTLDHVLKELDGILAGRAKYQGIPQQSWKDDII